MREKSCHGDLSVGLMLRRQIYQNHVNSAFSAPKASATDSVGGRKKSGCDATVASVKSGRLGVERASILFSSS